MTEREGGIPDPHEGIYVPACCTLNKRLGLVRVTKANVDGYGERWEVTIIDARRVTITLDVKRCPACGCYLEGLESVKLKEL